MIRSVLRSGRFWLGVVLAAVLLAASAQGVAWAEVRGHLASADYGWLAPAALAILMGQVARAARWQALFGDAPRPNLHDAFAILSIGYMLSNLLPLRLGDPVRAWLVGTRTPGDGAQALATVVAERVVDLLTILLLLAVFHSSSGARLLDDVTSGAVRLDGTQLAIAIAAAALSAFLVLVLASALSGQIGAATTRAAGRISPARADGIGAGVTRFLAGFGVMRSPRHAVRITILSIAVWLIGTSGYWLVARAFGLGLTFDAALFAVCAAALFAAFLPPSPGYVGAFHAAVQRSLALYAGVELSAGLSYALVLHALTFTMLMLMGLAGVWMMGLSSKSLASTLSRP